jgi:hypothetical protein
MKTLKDKLFLGLLVIAIFATASAIFSMNSSKALGSVAVGNENLATTTGAGGGFTGSVAGIVSNSAGVSLTLSQIYIAAPTVGIIEIYDATTTDVNARSGNIASSTLLKAVIPAGTGTSSIPYDIRLNYGLQVVFKGTNSSTTVMYRIP